MASQELPQQPWWMESNSYSYIHGACLTWGASGCSRGQQDHIFPWPRAGQTHRIQVLGNTARLQDMEIEDAKRMTESYREAIKLAPLIQALYATSICGESR